MELAKTPLDWYLDDGINLIMINDWCRNNFFEQSLKDAVADKNCIEVGFGTGLLSILALKHGAKHIVAFESDYDRYNLGLSIVEKLNLQDKIDLVHERYSHTHAATADVLFTETLDKTIWGEGLFNSIPRQKSMTMIPDQCFVNLSVIPVSQSLIDRLMINEHDPDIFNPLVDIDHRFVDYINEIIDDQWRDRKNLDSIATVRKRWAKLSAKKTAGLINVHNFPHEIINLYDKIITSASNEQAHYRVDLVEQNITILDANGARCSALDFDQPEICMDLDLSKSASPAVLVVFRPGICYKGHTLFLDRCESWGLPGSKIYRAPYGKITVSHDMSTNQLSFQ